MTLVQRRLERADEEIAIAADAFGRPLTGAPAGGGPARRPRWQGRLHHRGTPCQEVGAPPAVKRHRGPEAHPTGSGRLRLASWEGIPVERHAMARIYAIDRRIRAGDCPNAAALAAELEVSRRTVERDLEVMRDRLGAPLDFDRRRCGYRYLDSRWQLPPVAFTGGELLAVFLGTRLLQQAAGTPYEEPVRSAIEKIRTLLPAGVTVDLGLTGQVISFGVEPLRGDGVRVAEVFRALEEARRLHRTVSIRYYTASRDDTGERDVDPYHLHYKDGAWYLIAYCHRRRGVRTFALDRIEHLQATLRTFAPPVGFNVATYLADAWALEKGERATEVAVRFAPRQARYIRERVWHPSQRIEKLRDGGLILRVTVSGLGELKRWILQWGAEAEVLEPADVRAAMASEAAALARCYGVPGATGRRVHSAGVGVVDGDGEPLKAPH